MIIWRSGKAGFVGGFKTLIKGVLNPFYSKTTATIEPPEPPVEPDQAVADFVLYSRTGKIQFYSMSGRLRFASSTGLIQFVAR